MNVSAFGAIRRFALTPPVALFLLTILVTALVYQFPVTAVIDVGSGRDAPFVQGFSFREILPDGQSFRWSQHISTLRFWGIGASNGELRLRALIPAQYRNPVEVWANGRNVINLPQTAAAQEFSIPLAAGDIGWSGNLEIQLVSDTFTAPPDSRTLGVQVERVSFEGGGAPVIPSPRALLYLPALVVLTSFVALVWGRRARVALAVGVGTMLVGAIGLYASRVETAYFLAPVFWLVAFLFIGALVFYVVLQRLTRVLDAPTLSSRTMRLVFVAMVAAFVVRMVLAVGPGYIVDVQDYIVWSYKTVTYGLGTMYASVNGLWISDQSPGLNYVLHVMGLVYRGIFAPDFLYPVVAGDPAMRGATDNPALLADPVHRTLLRLPMLLADAVTGALILATARKYVAERAAWLVAGAFWFNPAVLANGAYWGQMDAIHALLVLICFLLIVFTPRIGLAFFIFGIAAFVKPQAMIFGPLLLLGAYRVDNFKGVARALVFGALGCALVLLPVVLTGGTQGFIAYMGDAVGHHPTVSANAHNLWWVVFHDDYDIADTIGIYPGAPLSVRAFSILLFGIFYFVTLFKAWRAPLQEFFLLGAFVAFAFFMLPTEIHENYGYALLPLLAVAMTRDTRVIVLYVAISATMTLNYALHDPAFYAQLALSAPHVQLAPARWLDAVANLAILAVWMIYLFARRDLQLPFAKLFQPQATVK